MYILPNDQTFVPQGFLVCDFYGATTCFCWCDNRLVMFSYTSSNTSQETINTLMAPRHIKEVHCFTGRIFVICEPSGIYKLWRDLEFAVLSKTGVGIGTVFYEVLHIIDNCLYLSNKQEKSNKALFKLSVDLQKEDKLCTFPLSAESVDASFGKALWENESNCNCCIIANRNKVFKLADGNINIIHCCECSVKVIVPIWNMNKIAGLILILGNNSVLIMYHREGKIVFDNIHLDSGIVALCAGISQNLTDYVWLVHSDGHRIHYMKKRLMSNAILRIKSEIRNFIFLNYYNNMMLGLSASKQLQELPITAIENLLTVQNADFIPLNGYMLRGSEIIIEKICDRVQELSSQNKLLLIEQDKLRRINFYAYKQRIKFCPKIQVERIVGETFLIVDFNDMLPKNTKISVCLQSNTESIYCIQDVKEPVTVVKMHIPNNDILSERVNVSFDLIVLAEENRPWLIIDNYIIDPPASKKRKGRSKKDKTSFLLTKTNMVKNLIEADDYDMQKLSEIKKSIRKEMSDAYVM